MAAIAMKDLLEAGVHFGHQTKRWNPKMKEYIFGERNGIYIIDLGKTVKLFRDAEEFVTNLAAEGRTILFVGTKRQAQDVDRRRSAALRHVLRQRALARRPAHQLRDHSAQPRPAARPRSDGDRRPLRHAVEERNRAQRERAQKLQKNLEGIRGMSRLPDAVFIVDTKKEQIAVDEARKLKIPVIGIVDTNCDPDEVDFVIPGNDDALRSIRLFASRIADAVLAGRDMKQSVDAEAARDAGDDGGPTTAGAQRAPAPAPARSRPGAPRNRPAERHAPEPFASRRRPLDRGPALFCYGAHAWQSRSPRNKSRSSATRPARA